MKSSLYRSLFCLFLFINCTNPDADDNDEQASTAIPTIPYTVSAVFDHDTSYFTQGLIFYKGSLWEGTGNYGQSKLIKRDLKSGKILQQISLEPEYFGEGITILNDTIYQLTWKEKKVFVYTPDFKKIKEFDINTEGWGITTDGSYLIVSDGSSNLYFYEPSTFRLMRTQGITENSSPVVNINELEYINGFIYANQWQYNYILKIDPSSGQVLAKIDLTELTQRAKAKYAGAEVLNGIAYDSTSKKVYVTGKNWPELYELQFNF